MITKDGYLYIRKPDHPCCNSRGFVPKHRLIMEKLIGRYLSGIEVVHHINGDKSDNRICNLWLCKNSSEHHRIHHPPIFCKICGKVAVALGLCNSHYLKTRQEKIKKPCEKCGKKIFPNPPRAKDGKHLCRKCRWPDTKCTICGKPAKAKGLCYLHYNRTVGKIKCSQCGKDIWKSGRHKMPPMCWECTFPKKV